MFFFPVQGVFERYAYGASDSNYALCYILVANIFLYMGFYQVKNKGSIENKINAYQVQKPLRVVVLFFLSLFFMLLIKPHLSGVMAYLLNFLNDNFLTPERILIVLAAHAIVFRDYLSSVYIKIVLIGSFMLIILQTLAFSRSGLLTFADTLLIVVLAILSNIKFPRKFLYVGLILMPFLLVMALNIYTVSTMSRQLKGDGGKTFAEKVELLQASYGVLQHDPRADFFMGQTFSRMGYFDFSAEIIANSEHYARVFNVRTYFKSIVDNILSPGFDVFDQPKISSSLKYVYRNLGEFSKEKDKEQGHTDHFGLYGEMYALFGFLSLPLLFLLAYGLKKMYCFEQIKNPTRSALMRVLILMMFHRLMNSFGLDWVLLKMVILFISFELIYRLSFCITWSSRRIAI
ncbi:MAG: hypothetical protein P1U36_02600 [Legionellaceae bacterium]|nr:hypothetical protein [Legionellaceae bacterium]